MKKLLTILLLLISVICAYSQSSTDIKFDVPTGFLTDTVSSDRLIVKGDSAIAYIQFLSIPNLDKGKAKAAHDSVFVDVAGLKLIGTNLDGNADVINKYFDAQDNKYIKIYRHLHSDGLTYIFAISNTDDFVWSDTIDSSYHKGMRWYWIALIILAGILWMVLCFSSVDNFAKNWPRFIVCATLAIVMFLICSFVFHWIIALMFFVFFLLIGIAGRCGLVVIPI